MKKWKHGMIRKNKNGKEKKKSMYSNRSQNNKKIFDKKNKKDKDNRKKKNKKDYNRRQERVEQERQRHNDIKVLKQLLEHLEKVRQQEKVELK